MTAEIKMVKYYYEESALCFSAVTCSAGDLCTCCRGKDFIQVTERKSIDEHLVIRWLEAGRRKQKLKTSPTNLA